jgi:hypothetical protein
MLPEVELTTESAGPSLKLQGRLLACPAIHKSAEPDSLVVKIGFDERERLIAADPEVYYVTEHYTNYPSVLVRMSRIHPESLRDLLGMASLFARGGTKTKTRGDRKVAASRKNSA